MENQMKRVEPQAPSNHWVFTKAPNLRWVFAPPGFIDPRRYVRDTVPVYPELKKKKKPHQIFDKKFRKEIAHTALWFNLMKGKVPRIIDLKCDLDKKINEVMTVNCITLKDVFGEPPDDDSKATSTGAESSSSLTTARKNKQTNTQKM